LVPTMKPADSTVPTATAQMQPRCTPFGSRSQ
jgi:hypothetical protein